MEISPELKTPLQYLKAVGPKRAEAFSKAGLTTIYDLLYYFPTRYLDRSTILTSVKVINYLINGYEGEVTIIGKVVEQELIRRSKRQIFKVTMKDSTGFFECVWFQGVRYFKDRFKTGQNYAISAKPVLTRYGHLQFAHPDFDFIPDEENLDFKNTGKIIPFYKIPKELKSSNIGDMSLRRIMNNAVSKYIDCLPETLPQYIITQQTLPDIISTVRNMHFPESNEMLNSAKNRLIFEEFLTLELIVSRRRYKYKKSAHGVAKPVKSKLIHRFLEKLPFELTGSQLKVLSEIRKDMESSLPMNRLLQGDVGSGKTIVAIIAMLICVDNGFQAALMAPTEILADQHYKKLNNLLEGLDVNISLLLGSQSGKMKNEKLKNIEDKESQIIIGTHAIFQQTVKFKNLGLVVIDEQHRFGVEQRMKLIKKAETPDVLIMTATPIPRTLTMTLYGDLDVSVISEMPKNRLPVKTIVRNESKLPEIYSFVEEKALEGYQSFIVYPLIEETEKSDLKDAETYYRKLQNEIFPNLKVGLLHGKMSWQEKEKVMVDFAAKEYDILVSTTVIEVGIDIPDANIIIINDAFQFGLSQLHQLRGRVGRSNKQAYCILIAKKNINKSNIGFNFDYLSRTEIEKQKASIRLNSMVNISDGFKLSEIDLKLRGPGDIFGSRQSGFPELKYGNIITDFKILATARKTAFDIIEKDPELNMEENQSLKTNFNKYYSNKTDFSDIA